MNSKPRIAFFPPTTSNWMGGVNYFTSLFYAIKTHSNTAAEVHVFVNAAADDTIVTEYRKYTPHVHSPSFLNSNSRTHAMIRLENRLLGSNRLLERQLRPYEINVVSHSPYAGFPTIRSIGWIPDFQHLHLPEMFSYAERLSRTRAFVRLANKCDAIVLSSYDSLKDFNSLTPKHSHKAFVLQFTTRPHLASPFHETSSEESINEKYGLNRPYFYLPNQFWRHKDHITAFKAVQHLKSQGIDILLVCSGKQSDARCPHHVPALIDHIKAHRLENNIRLLGMVPYGDVRKLIENSLAVLNPSLFEGWSSTVEECKSMKKPVIISDIGVHKEQAPHAFFFNRGDHYSLAQTLKNFDTLHKSSSSHTNDHSSRIKRFSERYLNLVEAVLAAQRQRLTGKRK